MDAGACYFLLRNLNCLHLNVWHLADALIQTNFQNCFWCLRQWIYRQLLIGVPDKMLKSLSYFLRALKSKQCRRGADEWTTEDCLTFSLKHTSEMTCYVHMFCVRIKGHDSEPQEVAVSMYYKIHRPHLQEGSPVSKLNYSMSQTVCIKYSKSK